MTRFLLLLLLPMVAVGGCDRAVPQVRKYREIVVIPNPSASPASAPTAMPSADGMASTSVQTANAGLKWVVPAGWAEQGASQMRLMTFRVGAEGAECSITIFPGDVGGLEANLRRWLGQLKVQVADDEVARFSRAPETFQTEGNLPCLVFDFGALLPDEKPDSLLAAVVPLEGSTAFVKLTGPKSLLAAEKENFRALCRSLTP